MVSGLFTVLESDHVGIEITRTLYQGLQNLVKLESDHVGIEMLGWLKSHPEFNLC